MRLCRGRDWTAIMLEKPRTPQHGALEQLLSVRVVPLWPKWPNLCISASFNHWEEGDDETLYSWDRPEWQPWATYWPHSLYWTASPSLKGDPCGASQFFKTSGNYWQLNGALQFITFSYLVAHLLLTIQIWSWCAVVDFITVQNICCSSLWKNYFLPHW